MGTTTTRCCSSGTQAAEDASASCTCYADLEEMPEKHMPELCSECIRTGTWCSGSLHLPGTAAALDRAASLMCPDMHWSLCEGGVEAEVELESRRLLLQIRPRLFCITDADVKLFG